MSIHVIVGPMCAGKTAALIQKVKLIPQNKVVVIKHIRDVRFSTTHAVSRDGARFEATSFSSIEPDGKQLFGALFDQITTIAIDEGHFFPNIRDCAHQWALKGKQVIIATIHTGIFLEHLPHVSALLSIADTITLLKNACIQCGAEALFNYRKTPLPIHPSEDPITAYYGDVAEYAAVCRRCFHKRLAQESLEKKGFHSAHASSWDTTIQQLLQFKFQNDLYIPQ